MKLSDEHLVQCTENKQGTAIVGRRPEVEGTEPNLRDVRLHCYSHTQCRDRALPENSLQSLGKGGDSANVGKTVLRRTWS